MFKSTALNIKSKMNCKCLNVYNKTVRLNVDADLFLQYHTVTHIGNLYLFMQILEKLK